MDDNRETLVVNIVTEGGKNILSHSFTCISLHKPKNNHLKTYYCIVRGLYHIFMTTNKKYEAPTLKEWLKIHFLCNLMCVS